MTPAQWNRLKDVFQGALDQPPHARRAWLVEQCADDGTLFREAEALLQTHETAGDFLEEPAHVDPEDLDTLLPGTQIGAYRVNEEIGRGGMGVVYLAEDVRLGRRVALKSLPAAVAMHPELRERLRREARAAATISHPAVAVVYALEEMNDHLFIASEYVRGETLRSEIARGPMPPERARSIAAEIADALDAAHDAGVIHRDLKPENVLIKPDGGVKVVDFGIAQIEGPEGTRLTRAGAMLGTPAYMAPEQLLGAAVDRRADIYAWGVVMSEMLTGRHPLRRDATGRAGAVVTGPFATIIGRCLEADPAARYQSARDLRQALGSDPGPAKAGHYAQHDRSVGQADHSPTPTRFWWEFHLGVTALVYWLMTIPAWYARGHIGSWPGRTFFIVLLLTVVVAAIA